MDGTGKRHKITQSIHLTQQCVFFSQSISFPPPGSGFSVIPIASKKTQPPGKKASGANQSRRTYARLA